MFSCTVARLPWYSLSSLRDREGRGDQHFLWSPPPLPKPRSGAWTCRLSRAWNWELKVFPGTCSLASLHLMLFIYKMRQIIPFSQGGHAHQMMHVNSWLLKIQCFDFLFWYNRDYSKGFYSPWLKNKPCSTEQRVNIEILPVPNFDLESMESRMTHCEMGIDQNMFLYQITIFHWSHILTGRYSGILRAKTKDSLNSCVFPPSNAQLPWRVSAGLLENAKREI